MSRSTTTLLFAMTVAAPAAADPNVKDEPPAGLSATPAADPDPKPTATATEDKKPDAEPTKHVAALEPRPVEEQRVDTVAPKAPREDHGTPRFEITGGVFLQSRGLDFVFDPNADGAPPAYPASSLSGFQVAAAFYPLPIEHGTGQLSGLGFSFKVAKSGGSTLAADDGDTFGDYPIDYTAYEAGVHYRYPIDKVAIDGELAYGSSSHVITGLPDAIEIPDTTFQYIGAGVHLAIYPNEHATIELGAKYLSVFSTGDVSSAIWYGSGTAGGVVLDANVSVPLPAHLFLRGGLEWKKIWIDFDGSGDLSDAYGVSSMTDTSVTGSAQLGLQF